MVGSYSKIQQSLANCTGLHSSKMLWMARARFDMKLGLKKPWLLLSLVKTEVACTIKYIRQSFTQIYRNDNPDTRKLIFGVIIQPFP
jgi:hypothetical protein